MPSRIRRKPLLTYKSPSADDQVFITLSLSPSTSKAPTPIAKVRPPSRSNQVQREDVIRTAGTRHYPVSSSLPLFHPLGRLAMSLPPLDPTKYGLPIPPVPDIIQESKSSSRLRRPAAKLREMEEEATTVLPTVSTVAAVAAREAKERPSPRKRRGGGGKRKRKDVDDGDATYPAKRTRIPRGNAGQNVEEELPMEAPQFDVPAIMESFSELPETAKRRSTRAKGSLKRRDSSASETTSVSGSANAIYAGTDTNTTGIVGPQKLADVGILAEGDDKDEREEGELSEEQLNP
ncbi:hypothetical protein M413DRAFT_441844 [Hebeloma cylindrosporum]|uniref:Uncharacterized protein n=1 Tax=Hebeloma cylindrosporum TaxID=76867 RepID=A0A0C2Y5R5_HEBCY|nr:hypothetical protein M413DRAFT_441844 [Hebeloma cylindrosporum h7]